MFQWIEPDFFEELDGSIFKFLEYYSIFFKYICHVMTTLLFTKKLLNNY